MVTGLEFAGWPLMKAAVGQGTTEPFVEEQEQQRDLNPLGGEAVSVAGTIALQQSNDPCLMDLDAG